MRSRVATGIAVSVAAWLMACSFTARSSEVCCLAATEGIRAGVQGAADWLRLRGQELAERRPSPIDVSFASGRFTFRVFCADEVIASAAFERGLAQAPDFEPRNAAEEQELARFCRDLSAARERLRGRLLRAQLELFTLFILLGAGSASVAPRLLSLRSLAARPGTVAAGTTTAARDARLGSRISSAESTAPADVVGPNHMALSRMRDVAVAALVAARSLPEQDRVAEPIRVLRDLAHDGPRCVFDGQRVQRLHELLICSLRELDRHRQRVLDACSRDADLFARLRRRLGPN